MTTTMRTETTSGGGSRKRPSRRRTPRAPTATSAFGVGRRESHDASAFYSRFTPPVVSDDDELGPEPVLDDPCILGDSRNMHQLPDNCVALVVTSPPYFVGKEYELAVADPAAGVPESYLAFLDLLRDVFAECVRVLEPGGRIAVNVANLGRKPYRSLSADVIRILQDDLGLLLRGEILWQKGKTQSGSCAWGSFASPANPVLRDITERVVVASKGRFDRALPAAQRRSRGLPHQPTLSNDEFVETTRDVWEIDAESARRVGHPAPFPVELPRRLIDLYTYEGDLVLDPLMGSGSALVAAVRAGRRAVGYDIDPAYVELARERLDAERDRSDRHDELRARAQESGRGARDIARGVLEGAGFTVTQTTPAELRRAGLQFDLVATTADGAHRWYVDVAGAFTTTKPGLVRTETLWRLLGRLHVLRGLDRTARVLVLTPSLPNPGSEGDRALRAVGPEGLFDAVELYDPAGSERLAGYAAGETTPAVGFWRREELDAMTP